jgi:hypothetical protein
MEAAAAARASAEFRLKCLDKGASSDQQYTKDCSRCAALPGFTKPDNPIGVLHSDVMLIDAQTGVNEWCEHGM